jgi:hypothetical protein
MAVRQKRTDEQASDVIFTLPGAEEGAKEVSLLLRSRFVLTGDLVRSRAGFVSAETVSGNLRRLATGIRALGWRHRHSRDHVQTAAEDVAVAAEPGRAGGLR